MHPFLHVRAFMCVGWWMGGIAIWITGFEAFRIAGTGPRPFGRGLFQPASSGVRSRWLGKVGRVGGVWG